MTPGLPENLGAECALTPDGLELKTPGKLSFGYEAAGLTGFDPRLIRIYRLDLTLGQWVESPTTPDDMKGTVWTSVGTDSRYALGLVRGGF